MSNATSRIRTANPSRRHARPASSYVASTRGHVDVSGGRWTPSDWLNEPRRAVYPAATQPHDTACTSGVSTRCPATNHTCDSFRRNDVVDDDVVGAVVARFGRDLRHRASLL